MKYYVIINNQQFGPVDEQQMRGMGINRDTLVWRDGMPQWSPAGDLPELAFLFTTPPSPQFPTMWPGSVAGLVLGIFSILCIEMPVIGFVLGFIGVQLTKDSYREYRMSPKKYASGGMLEAAYIMSRVGFWAGIVVTGLLVLGILVYVFALCFAAGAVGSLVYHV